MDLDARVDVNCGWKDGRTDGQTDGRKTGRLYRTLPKQMPQKESVITIHDTIDNQNLLYDPCQSYYQSGMGRLNTVL